MPAKTEPSNVTALPKVDYQPMLLNDKAIDAATKRSRDLSG